jgi:hypothetical protein
MTNVTITKSLSTQLEHYASQLGENDVMFFPPSEAKRLWQQFREAHGLQGAPKLLTHPEEQHKLGLSEAYSVGLTLQSADGSGFETCPWRGECASVCVLKNGNGMYPKVQLARDVKTQFLAEHPLAFLRLLSDEFDSLRRMQQHFANGDVETWIDLRCRMNVNSDLRWYKIAPWLFTRNDPWIQFYDYTKNPAVLTIPKGKPFENYLLVYSVSESTNMKRVATFLNNGGKAVVVTNRKRHAPIFQWAGFAQVVDGDVTDDLWTHPEGALIDLTAKGKARSLGEGFVRHVYSTTASK